MKIKTICSVLIAFSASISLSSAQGFEESPALPERPLPGGADRQRALPEDFAAVASPAWAFEAPAAPANTSQLIAACQAGKADAVKALPDDFVRKAMIALRVESALRAA